MKNEKTYGHRKPHHCPLYLCKLLHRMILSIPDNWSSHQIMISGSWKRKMKSMILCFMNLDGRHCDHHFEGVLRCFLSCRLKRPRVKRRRKHLRWQRISLFDNATKIRIAVPLGMRIASKFYNIRTNFIYMSLDIYYKYLFATKTR